MTTRRDLLKGAAAGVAAGLLGPSLLTKTALAQGTVEPAADGVWKITGSHWGAIRARVDRGKVAEVVPFEDDQNPTDMYKGIHGLIYNPSRIKYPMARVDWLKNRKNSDRTQRGDNRFVRITWDQALDLFYEELERVQTEYGPWALYAGHTGWRQTGQFHSCTNHMNRAVSMHGNYVKKVADYSTGAGQTMLPYTLGSTEVYSQGTSWPLILDNAKVIVFWANDPKKNLQVGWTCETHGSMKYLDELRDKVAAGEIRVISVDPVKTKTANHVGAEHLYLNPQTDVPFMLGIAHTLYNEGLYDKDFIGTYTLGFDDFIQYVQGKADDGIEKTPEWAANICGVDADTIRAFARLMAANRTQLVYGWALQRQQHGEQPYWMAAVLASMLGQIGLPGGGISYSHHYSGVGVPTSGAAMPGAFPLNLDLGMYPEHDSENFNGASRVIPVARWVDCLLNPGEQINHNGNKVTFPDIKMCVFTGCNPFHHHQDHNRMREAFRKLETVVTVDYSWNATCRHSDLVLPACTQFERNDIDGYGAYSNSGVLAMHQLVDPLFQSKTDFEIFTELTHRFGRNKEYTRDMDEGQWLRFLYGECKKANEGKFDMPEFDQFWEEGIVRFPEGKPWVRHADFRKDPELNALGTPSGFIEITSRRIEGYGYDDCGPYPKWFEKAERSHGGPGSDKHPLWLQSCHPDQRLHSQMCESDEYRETYAVQGREPIYMSPEDAAARGIADGDVVRVFNDRGQLLAGARVSDNYPQGVVRIHEGAWYGPVDASIGALDTYGDPNTLTMDVGTSQLAQATSANTCLVEMEKFEGPLPPVTSFGGPTEV
ncbi:trimethylamine-N-oxide reductase TorA [Rhodobacteraceae bacterium RKSG542]|uniref:trimethylamine-N-oxide reductase TorA n=1 Tax=Pseudovibrio flavus TaxID=2529854 RepID=UPI0012BD0417|nr:trimethylamine-N-oxide reductase TorA [Pseudovibrio flavus]MTI16237.1 trimethylamine-N-oxide reductase TorA [Pseudovibrio flavus]